MILTIKNFPSVTRRCRCRSHKFSPRLLPPPLKARKLKFWLPESFGPTWCPLYSEFWNLKSLGYHPYKFRLRKVNPWVLFSKFYRRSNLMAYLVTILGARNQKKYSEFKNFTSYRYLLYKFHLRKVKTLSFVKQIFP
jgi:hypothetical protein